MCVCVYVCASISSLLASPFQNGITKFWPDMDDILVKIPIFRGVIGLEFQGHIWLQIHNLPHLELVQRHHSLPVQGRISKFEPEMHLSTVTNPINIGLGGSWPYRGVDSNTTAKRTSNPIENLLSAKGDVPQQQNVHIMRHTHTHTYIYIYIYMFYVIQNHLFDHAIQQPIETTLLHGLVA